MTKKNYELLARTLKDALRAGIEAGWDDPSSSEAVDIGSEAIKGVVERLCASLAVENPRFNAHKFREAIYGKE